MTKTYRIEEEVLVNLRPVYIKRLAGQISDIQHAFNKSDYNSVADLAHQIKGIAGSFGFPEIGSLCSELEQLTRERKQHQGTESLINRIKERSAELMN